MEQPSLQARSDDWLRWAFGVVLLWRLLFPFFDSPLLHLFSDPARHWSNGGRFFLPDLIGAGDPFLYQLWIYLLRVVSQGDEPSVVLGCGLLCAAMPYGWYRALRELLPRRAALIGGLIIGVIPAFIGIYAYFMTETLLLTLTGFAFWATFRAARKRTVAAFALASALWACAMFTRSIALPMALLCLSTLWLTQQQRLVKAVSALAIFMLLALPAGLHARSTLGFFAPLGNFYLSQIYSASGRHDISINAGPLGAWGFGTPSFYNPTFYPFSKWTTDREGTAYITIDVARGRASWIAEKKRIEKLRSFPWWRQYRENLIYLLFGQSWPDDDPNAWSGLATVWTRWLWPPLMLVVARTEGSLGLFLVPTDAAGLVKSQIDMEITSPENQWMLYLDERASDEQAAALEAIFTGELGGDAETHFPWAWKPSELLGVRRVAIEVDHTRRREWLRIRNHVTVRIRDRYPGEAVVTCVIPGHDRDGEELVADKLAVSDGDLSFEYTDTCGYAATFSYAG